jgi:ribosomal protein S18 acetylase RimI-like enzyme
MRITLVRDLPEGLRPDAARLYWEAFGGKLAPVLGPEPKAMAYLARVMRRDHCFVALDEGGRLIGLAGFKSPSGSFAGGTLTDMTRTYGWLGSRWRAAILWLLSREVDNHRFLVDGICVARQQRGLGVGTALLQALYAEAQARGYGMIRLDVIDTNWRARALYERLGFVALKTERIGLLRHVFGFASATTMVRALPRL